MRNQLILTQIDPTFQKENGNLIFAGLRNDDRFVEIQCQSANAETLLGNIYIGRVKNIVKNINAAFVEIKNGLPCYLPLEDCKHPIFVKKNGGNLNDKEFVLKGGDELLVQVSQENIKTKSPRLTTDLNLTGEYAVLTTEKKTIGVSNKIDADKKKTLKSEISERYGDTLEAGLIIRTNAKDVSLEQLFADIDRLVAIYEEKIKTAVHKTVFSCIYQKSDFISEYIRRQYTDQITEIVTDEPHIYEQIMHTFSDRPEIASMVRLYEDESYSMKKLYNIRQEMEHATQSRVWLKSGAYLVIEPTEALTVIDVNSGKNTKKSDMEQYFLQVNLEAAAEIAVQLRLRNISGICIVDFIDMKTQNQQILMKELKKLLATDPVKTTLVDITPLNLVEITRKKIYRPLKEQLK